MLSKISAWLLLTLLLHAMLIYQDHIRQRIGMIIKEADDKKPPLDALKGIRKSGLTKKLGISRPAFEARRKPPTR